MDDDIYHPWVSLFTTPKSTIYYRTETPGCGSSEQRWRSEGIQIGGVQSARGVLGYWFDK